MERKHKYLFGSSLKQYCKDTFCQQLASQSWEEVLSCLEVDTALDKFKVLFHSVLDVVAPVKEIRLKQRTEPWMTSEILHDIRHRDDVLNKFRKTKDSDLYRTFCKLRNKIQRETKVAKRHYLANKIEGNANNPKRIWHQLK